VNYGSYSTLLRKLSTRCMSSFEDRVEADLPCVPNAFVERDERVAVVEIRGVHRVSGFAVLVRKRKKSGCLALCVVE
jgi:hypothetical protein